MTRTIPRRRTILHFAQIFLTDDRTFMGFPLTDRGSSPPLISSRDVQKPYLSVTIQRVS